MEEVSLGYFFLFFFCFFVFSGGYWEKEPLGDPHYDTRMSPSGGRKWAYL